MPWGFEEQQRTVLVQVFCTEAWAEKKGYYMEISLILNDLTIDYSQSRTHDPILDAQHIDKTFQKSTGGCRVSTRGFYEITKKLMGHSASAVCCFVCCFGGTTSLHNKSSRLLLHGNKNWECSDLHRLFFWLHVPHFCLLGRKKDFKSDDFLFFLKHIIGATTVTYSNLEFFFYMSWHGWCQEFLGGKSRSGPCCFMNRICLVLNRNEHDNTKYMLHPDYHARASKEFLVCL